MDTFGDIVGSTFRSLVSRASPGAVGWLGAGGSGVQDGGGDPFGYPTWVSEGGFIRLAAGLRPGAAYILRLRPCRRPPGWKFIRLETCRNAGLQLWLVTGGWGPVLGTFGLTLGPLWRSLGGSWGPLASHWVPLGSFKDQLDHLWDNLAPFW